VPSEPPSPAGPSPPPSPEAPQSDTREVYAGTAQVARRPRPRCRFPPPARPPPSPYLSCRVSLTPRVGPARRLHHARTNPLHGVRRHKGALHRCCSRKEASDASPCARRTPPLTTAATRPAVKPPPRHRADRRPRRPPRRWQQRGHTQAAGTSFPPPPSCAQLTKRCCSRPATRLRRVRKGNR